MATMGGVLNSARPPTRPRARRRRPEDALHGLPRRLRPPLREEEGWAAGSPRRVHVVVLLGRHPRADPLAGGICPTRPITPRPPLRPPPPPPPPLPRAPPSRRSRRWRSPRPPTHAQEAGVRASPRPPRKRPKVQPEDKLPGDRAVRQRDGQRNRVVDGGLEGGVEGGVVGGVLGGVLGGCVGCTGDGPVLDYDQPPRQLKMTKPVVPSGGLHQEDRGRRGGGDPDRRQRPGVLRARRESRSPSSTRRRSRRSCNGVFTPAMKKGRPVATWANAPVSFRIFCTKAHRATRRPILDLRCPPFLPS